MARPGARELQRSWVRTGLGLMGFGFVVARFGLFLRELAAARQGAVGHPGGGSMWLGVALVVLGIAVTLLAAIRHLRLLRHLAPARPYAWPFWPLEAVVALVLAVLSLGLAIYL